LSGNDLSLAAVTLFSAFCSLLLSKSSFLVLLKGWCDHLGFKGKTGLRNPAKKTTPATQKEALVEAPQNKVTWKVPMRNPAKKTTLATQKEALVEAPQNKVPGKARKQDTPEDDDNDNVPPEEAAKEPIVKAVKTVPVNEAVSDMMTTAAFLGNLIDKEEGWRFNEMLSIRPTEHWHCSRNGQNDRSEGGGIAKERYLKKKLFFFRLTLLLLSFFAVQGNRKEKKIMLLALPTGVRAKVKAAFLRFVTIEDVYREQSKRGEGNHFLCFFLLRCADFKNIILS